MVTQRVGTTVFSSLVVPRFAGVMDGAAEPSAFHLPAPSVNEDFTLWPTASTAATEDACWGLILL